MLLHMITNIHLFVVALASTGNGSKMYQTFPSNITTKIEVDTKASFHIDMQRFKFSVLCPRNDVPIFQTTPTEREFFSGTPCIKSCRLLTRY